MAERGETAGGHLVAQEIHFRDGEGTLLEVDDQPGCLEAAEHLFHVSLVLLHRGAGYDDIVEVDK